MQPYLDLSFLPFEMDGWYLMHVIGTIVAIAWAIIRRPKDFPISRFGMFIGAILLVAFGLFGARVGYALIHSSPFYDGSPFMEGLTLGGFAYLGTMLFAALVILAFTKLRLKRISFLVVSDYVLPFVLLEQAFGRMGCFLVGCCYGKPTELPWGCVFMTAGSEPRHPTQIYYMLFLLFIFFTMRYLYKKALKPGMIFFGTIFLYGFFRFFGEFLRVDSPQIVGSITAAQITMLGIAILGAFGMTFVKLKK